MASSQATHRPSPAKGSVQLKEAAAFGGDLADGKAAKPKGPPPPFSKSKGLNKKGGPKGKGSDGGMDSADGGGAASAGPPAGGGASSGGGGASSGGGGGGGATDTGSAAGKAAAAVTGAKGSKPAAATTATGKVGKELFSKKPSDFIASYKTAGTALTAAKAKDETKAHDRVPTLHAVLPDDAQAAAAGKKTKPSPDSDVTDGVAEGDAKKPEKGKEKAEKSAEQKVGSADAAKAKELEDFMEQLKGFFSSMVTSIDTDSEVKTSPGAPPPVKLEGKSNPTRAVRQDDDAEVKMDSGLEEFSKAIDDGLGPADVHRVPMDEAVEPQIADQIVVADQAIEQGLAYYEGIEITGAEREAADGHLDPIVSEKLAKADQDLAETLETQEQEREASIQAAEAETEALNAEAQAEQEELVAKTKKDIGQEQKKTKKAQDKELKSAKRKGDKERRAVEGKITKRQADDDRKVKKEFKDAEKKSKAEKDKSERKARDEKRKAEEKKKNQSWWDRVKSAVSSIVDACCKVIGGIFDVLGKLVSGIINAVKDLACGIIDLACKFAKGLLDGLATMMKGLVSGLLGQVFPELADKLNGFIDKGMDACKKGIDYVGDKLKKGVEAAADATNAAIQKGLQVAKTGITTAVRVAGCIAVGDFEGAFMQVFYGACEMAGLSRADAEKMLSSGKETLKSIVDNPIGFIKNLIKAGVTGFKNFASGFAGFFKKALTGWLVGPLGKEGLKIPKVFNVLGIFRMVASLLGVTKDWLVGLVKKKVGPKATSILEKVYEYVEAFMEDGLAGLWKQLKGDVGNLWKMLMDFVVDFIQGKVVTFAVEKLGSLLAGPIGALWQILKTAYSIYCTIRDKMSKIKEVLSGVFGSIADIARGSIGGAAGKIVKALVAGMGIAIDLFARLANMGDIPKRIKKFLTGLRKKVQGSISKLLDKIVGKVKGLFKGGKKDDSKDKKKDGKDKTKLPPPIQFKAKDGHTHKLYAVRKGSKPVLMVASTPKTVKAKIAEWQKTLKDMPKTAKKKAGGLIGQAVRVEADAEKIAKGIVNGTKTPDDLAKKMKSGEKPLKELFGILEGPLGGKIDPAETLLSEKYGKFKGQFIETAKMVGMSSGAPKEAERIWVLTVGTMLKKDTKGRFDASKGAGGRADLTSTTVKDIMVDLKPIAAALGKYMDAHAKKNKKGTWGFWSGSPADPVARMNSDMSLEKSALGKAFDGVNIDGKWNIELWATLSQAYATYAAKNFEKKTFLGFVGLGSSKDMSIFNKIEQPTFKMLTKSKKAKAKVTFYAVAGKKNAKGKLEPDTSKSAGGKKAVFKSGARGPMVKAAEEYNQNVLDGKGGNLFEHLKAAGDASDSIDPGLKAGLSKAKAPADSKKKMPAVLPEVIAARPTLKTLFTQTSTVGKSLSSSLSKVEAEVPVNGVKQKRGFGAESPWLAPLKRAVSEELAGPVRTPTIAGQVLKKPKPVLPQAGKKKIVGWLKKQKGKDEAGDVPRSYSEYGKVVKRLRAADFSELKGLSEKLIKDAGEAHRLHTKLDLDVAVLEEMKKEYLALRDKLDEESVKLKKALEHGISAREMAGAADTDGKTMVELLEKAKKLVKEIKADGGDSRALKGQLEGVMHASILLGGQIDPEGLSKGRKLYDDIDDKTHKKLLKSAQDAGFSKRDQAKLASDWRNWLREFFRKDVMADQNHSEILFLRDQGIRGSRKGLPFDKAIAKAIKNLKKPSAETKKAVLRDDFTMDTATEAELDKVYGEVIRKAGETNKGVNASAARKPGKVADLPKEQYKQGDASHTIKHDGKTLNRHSVKKPVKEVVERGEAWTLADAIDADCKAFLGKNPKRVQEQGSEELKQKIKADVTRLKALMLKARGLGAELSREELVKKRDKFESELAKRAQGYKWATGAADYMADKAWSIMAAEAKPALLDAGKLDKELIQREGLMDDPDFRKLVKSTGLSLTSGFAGAVGKSFEKIKRVFKSGNLRTKVQHVVNFGEAWSARAFAADAEVVKKTLAAVGVKSKEIKEFERLHQLAKSGRVKPDKKGMFGGAGGDSATQARDSDYKEAKSGTDMDRKFPSLPLATLDRAEIVLLARRKGLKPRETTPTDKIIQQLEALQTAAREKELERKGKSFIDPKSTGLGGPATMSERGKDDPEVGLSSDEQQARGLKKDLLPFMEGSVANIVDENHWWIKEARDLKMPLKAGISGTTSRYMHFAKLMSAPDMYSQRLAVFAWAVPISAHSYHEVMSAAKAYCDYSKGKYFPFRPLNKKLLSAVAVASGSTKEEVDQVLGIDGNTD